VPHHSDFCIQHCCDYFVVGQLMIVLNPCTYNSLEGLSSYLLSYFMPFSV
jgi:hypothetical protein